MENQNYSLMGVIEVLLKWKKLIISVTLGAIITSCIISFILPVYYKSTAIFYAYNLRGFDPRNLITEERMDIFAGEQDSDRLISIGKSSILHNKMIRKFDLYKRYNIDPKEKHAKTKVEDEFIDNYKIIKNERAAIEVSIRDKDPKVAATMANEVVAILDSINKQPIIENNTKLFNIYKKQLDNRYTVLDSITHSLSPIKKNAESPNNKSFNHFFEIKEVDKRLTDEVMETMRIKGTFDRVSSLLDADLKSIYVIEPAEVSEKKSSPIRWLIVASSTVGTFLFMVLLVMLMELYQTEFGQIKKNERSGQKL
jgi:capsular polysaccharide biosynthesis protein